MTRKRSWIKGCTEDPGRMVIVDVLTGGEVLLDFGNVTVRLTDEQARCLAKTIGLELDDPEGKRIRMHGLRTPAEVDRATLIAAERMKVR